MDNQHKHIKGYRDLTQEEIDLMNEIKSHAEKTRELADKVAKVMEGTYHRTLPVATMGPAEYAESMRWWRIAGDHLQQGYMALTRSVARPESF